MAQIEKCEPITGTRLRKSIANKDTKIVTKKFVLYNIHFQSKVVLETASGYLISRGTLYGDGLLACLVVWLHNNFKNEPINSL
jgi:hypothetical protein